MGSSPSAASEAKTVVFEASVLGRLSQHDAQLLWTDFLRARDTLLFLVETKLSFWTRLPHSIVAIAHPDVSLARRCAQQSFNEYQAALLAGRPQHALMRRFFDPGEHSQAHVSHANPNEKLHHHVFCGEGMYSLIPVIRGSAIAQLIKPTGSYPTRKWKVPFSGFQDCCCPTTPCTFSAWWGPEAGGDLYSETVAFLQGQPLGEALCKQRARFKPVA